MEQLFFLVLLVVVGLGGNALKKYLEKQQAEREAAEHRAPRAGQTAAGRPTFYGRAGERALQPTAPPAPAVPPAVMEAIRRKAQRQAAAEEPEPALEAVGALESRHLEPHEVHPVASIEDRAASVATATATPGAEPAPAAAAAPTAPARVAAQRSFAELLKGKNAARSIILSEILGPPKGFGD